MRQGDRLVARLPGVVPLAGETDSQPVPVVIVAAAVNAEGAPFDVDSAIVWLAGLALPSW